MAPNVLLLRGDRTPDADFADSVSPQFQRQVARELGDRYRVGEVIGVGSMGVVFRGEHRKTSRDVAIKVALPLLPPDQRARFCREAEIGKRFDHPHCLRVEDFEVAGKDFDYMVMPLVRGRPLAERLGARQPVEIAVSWGLQLLRGLEHIHHHRIVHRDLKPANILVEDDERGEAVLRIADYGLAKPMLSDESSAMNVLSRDTMTGLMAGSPAYMAPEQAMALGCDVRSDLYAVGLILYEIVTGGLPRGEDDAFDQMRARLTEDVSQLLSFAPAPFARIVGKLLRARPDERYSSAREALEDIEAFAQGRPLPHAGRDALAPPPMAASIEATGPQRTTRSMDVTGPAQAIVTSDVPDRAAARRRPGLAIVALLGVAAIGVAGWMWWDASTKARSTTDDADVVVERVPSPATASERAPEPGAPAPAREAVAAVPTVVDAEPTAAPRAAPTDEPRTSDRSRRTSKRRDKPSKPAPRATPAPEPAPASTPPSIPRAPLLQDGLRKPGNP